MSVIRNLVLFSALIVNLIEPARILAIFPVPSISHQVVFRPLTQELVRRGHKVTVITPDPAFPIGGAPPNLTEIDVHDVSYKFFKEELMSMPQGHNADLMEQVKTFALLSSTIVDVLLSQENVMNLINNKNEQFDLLLLEACIRAALGFSYLYKVPVIQISSFAASHGNFETVGAPVHPILYTSINRYRNHNLNMWEKIKEIYNFYQITRIYDDYEETEHEMLKKYFGDKIPSVAELRNNVDMLFLNVHPIFIGIRPVPPSVVYMGGLHQEPDKELPADLKSILDSSKNGVIYISFGTNVDTSLFTADTIRIFVKVLSQLPYDVLWKWDAELPGRTENIRISKWWPQSDLLKHPNVKLFITQGGLQSTDEAITAGVPLIGIPMIGDQWLNTERYVHHKIGLKLDMETITEKHLSNAINTIMNDDSYRHNVVDLRNKMYDQPQSPLERAVWWTEHVLRHGGAKHLRSPAANMSWAEYLELELVLTVLAVFITSMSLFVFVIYLLCKLFLRKGFIKIKIS